MTESEKICNDIGAKFFCKDFVYQNLKYRDSKNNKIELCDGLFEYCKSYVALQVKERSKDTYGKSEESWLEDVVYDTAVKQILKTIDGIKNNKIIVRDMYQQKVELHKEYSVYPVIIFDNKKIDEYKMIVEINDQKINVFKLDDYEQMMNVLIHPFDILNYLQERTRMLKSSLPNFVFGENGDLSIFAHINSEKDFSAFFLNYVYEGDINKQNAALKLLNIIDKFRKTQSKVNNNYKKLLHILQMIEPKCAEAFMERFDYAMNKARENKFDITKTIQLIYENKKSEITFCSVGNQPIKKSCYEVICYAKQLQHSSDIVILIAFTCNNEDILIDWFYYDKDIIPDEKIKAMFDNLGMYNGTIDKNTFVKLCSNIKSLN